MVGRDFDTWLIPAMRIIVDFSLEEPMVGINSTDSPTTRRARTTKTASGPARRPLPALPFARERIEKQYDRVLVMKPE
jgi:acyl-homoserine-lactone acylase